MKKILASIALALTLVASLAAAPQKLTGVLTDSMCVRKHMMSGVSAAECVRECVKGGAKYVLVVNGKVYELQGDQKKLYDLAGQKIVVTGEVKGDKLSITAIDAAK